MVRVNILRTDGGISRDEFMRGGGYRNEEQNFSECVGGADSTVLESPAGSLWGQSN